MAKTYIVNGFTGNLAQIAKHFKIKEGTLRSRLRRGMSLEEAINTPIDESKSKSKIHTVNGFTGNIAQIAKHFEINKGTLRTRLKRGMPIEEAINTPINESRSNSKSKVYTVNGFTGNLYQIANRFKINDVTLRGRLKSGMSIEEAVIKPAKMIYTVNGFTGNLYQIANRFKINDCTLRNRLKTGMSIEEAISIPSSAIYTVDGFTGTIREISERFKINGGTLRNRLKTGMSIEEAISIPLQKIKTKDIKYNSEIGNLRYFCKKYNKDYVEVYNKLRHMHTLEYALESTSKPYQEE